MAGKGFPVCPHCGKFACPDCGEGFPSRDAYLAHRLDALAHLGIDQGLAKA